jgi:hypothetical protein
MSGISALIKISDKFFPFLSCEGISKRWRSMIQDIRASPDNKFVSPLILNFSAFVAVRNKFLFISKPVYGILL